MMAMRSDGMIKRTRGMEHPTLDNPRRARGEVEIPAQISFFSGLHVFLHSDKGP